MSRCQQFTLYYWHLSWYCWMIRTSSDMEINTNNIDKTLIPDKTNESKDEVNIVLIWKSYRACTSQRRTKNVKCIYCCQMFALFYSNFARWLVFVILKSLYSGFILLNIFFILISIHYDNLNVFLDKIQYFQHHMSFFY
jgi:hypothetical protein